MPEDATAPAPACRGRLRLDERAVAATDLVTNLGGYYVGLIRILDRKGLCAGYDGEEIRLKRSNEWSEHYDVNLSDRYVRRGSGIFRGACHPAAF